MLHLFRTVCSTDWKSRPSHNLLLVATVASRKEAIQKMDEDVRSWMAVDIAANEYNGHEGEPLPDGWDVERAKELAKLSGEELLEMWRDEDEFVSMARFEMRLEDGDRREFVERCEGDRTTIVYHFLREDHTPTECQ